MNRALLIAAFALAATALSSGWSVTCAQQDPPKADSAEAKNANPPTAAEKAAREQRKAEAALLARQKRDEMIKRRQQTREYIQKAVEGQNKGGTP